MYIVTALVHIVKHKVNGLIVKEVKLGEADRIITVLTPSNGIIQASAKNSLRPKSKLFSALGLFCYSELVLFEGKTMYRVDEATPIEVFFGIRSDIEAVSVAAYIAEILQILCPVGEESEKLLKLALNSLYMMSENKMQPGLVKAVFELRSLSESGFMPDLIACDSCGIFEGEKFCFDSSASRLLCEKCAGYQNKYTNLNAPALAALRHIVLSEDDKLFAFTVKSDAERLLKKAAEEYFLNNIDYPPKSLSFLKSILL